MYSCTRLVLTAQEMLTLIANAIEVPAPAEGTSPQILFSKDADGNPLLVVEVPQLAVVKDQQPTKAVESE